VPGEGPRLGVYEDEKVQVLAAPSSPLESFDALVELADGRARLRDTIGQLRRHGPLYPYRDLDRPPIPEAPHLLIPVQPLEVWAAGVTYERSREARLAETTTVGIYDKI
jgi:2-dehydro-3-deoxy-D-arabinonate dehydratase